jgi:hypothetical protein
MRVGQRSWAWGAALTLGACGSEVVPAAGVCPAGSDLPPFDHSIGPPAADCRLVGAIAYTTIRVQNARGEVLRDAQLVVRDRAGNARRCPSDPSGRECLQRMDGSFEVFLAAPQISVELLAPVPVAAAEYCPRYVRNQPNGPGCAPVAYVTETPLVITAP